MKRSFIFIAIAIILSGCESLDKSECEAGQWYDIGYNDAINGKGAWRIRNHTKACASYKITPDSEQYNAGHRQGTIAFCTPQRAFNRGKYNEGQHGNCPVSQFPHMGPAYNEGYQIYREKAALEQQIKEIEHDMTYIVDDIEALVAENEKSQELIDQGVKSLATATPEQRNIIYTQEHLLNRTIKNNQKEIDRLYLEKRPYEADIQRLRSEINLLNSTPMPLHLNR